MADGDFESREGGIDILENLGHEMGDSFYRKGALESLRRDYEGPERDKQPVGKIKSINDMLSYLRSAKDDASKNEKNTFTKRLDKATAFIDKNVDVTDLVEYFTGEREHWQQEVDRLQGTQGEDLRTAETNVTIFNSFLHTLEGQSPQSTSETKDEFTTVKNELEAKLAHEEERLPEYKYSPGEHLETFFTEHAGKRNITLKTVGEFVTAARDDLVAQGKRFETDNAGLIAVIDKATEFHRTRREFFETDSDVKTIAVAVKDGKIIEVDLEDHLKNTDGETYRFTPDTLIKYDMSRSQYKDKIEGTDRMEGANQALQRIEELLAKPRLRMTDVELLSTFQVINRHERYLEEGLDQIELRFDGLEGESLLKAVEADPETAKRFKAIKQQREITRALMEQIRSKEKTEGRMKRMFKGISLKRRHKKETNEQD